MSGPFNTSSSRGGGLSRFSNALANTMGWARHLQTNPSASRNETNGVSGFYPLDLLAIYWYFPHTTPDREQLITTLLHLPLGQYTAAMMPYRQQSWQAIESACKPKVKEWISLERREGWEQPIDLWEF